MAEEKKSYFGDPGPGEQPSPGTATSIKDRTASSRDPFQIQLPSINLPKGGGAIKGIEEKFDVNAVSGTFSFGIPIPLSPSRSGYVPAVGLNYNSGKGNSPFGSGWEFMVPSISRKTEKNLPQYKDEEDSDTFLLSDAEDLVPLLEKQGPNWVKYRKPKIENGIAYTVKRYRPRIEGSFAIIENWKNDATGETFWKTISRNNIISYFGLTAESRISDPSNPLRVFSWLLTKTHDDKGNISLYKYKKEDFVNIPKKLNEQNRANKTTQVYLKKVLYGNKKAFYAGDADPAESDFLFQLVLDYGEHDTAAAIPKDIDTEKNTWPCRKDAFSTYRSGFEIRTYRRCSRVLMFHCFDEPDLPHKPYLVKSVQFFYDDNLQLAGSGKNIEAFSYLVRARENGHKWNATANSYTTKWLPEMEFIYQRHEWDMSVKMVTGDSLMHAPTGIDDRRYQWVDLFGEGISGILSEQRDCWYYKFNEGNGNFSRGLPVSPKPSFSGLSARTMTLLDLEGNGVKCLVQSDTEPKGFFKLSETDEWEPFTNFASFPNIRSVDPNGRFIDLTGDGIADLLITEEDSLRWYKGVGEKGFEISESVVKEIDEEKGPVVVFADRTQSVFLADMTGDGLTDIVRIRNGEICYWPNLGYGKFGAKVNMDNAPVFDYPDLFNPSFLRLADIDGSGTTDIIYLNKNDFRVWMNLSGNEWTVEPQIISSFPAVDNFSDVSVLDFLGSGTACIVYSSSIAGEPFRYIDLMGSKKPHLLNEYHNNCGKIVTIGYRSSSFYYLDDKKEGRKWVTKLPFPVHCIATLRSEDKIRQTVFVTSYRYSHGYYDTVEKEFRGFARVEQLDTEDFNHFKLNVAKNVVEESLHQPPVRSIYWFHTGAYLGNDRIFHQLKEEYFRNGSFTEYDLPEPNIPGDLSADETREALRACKGLLLRTEVYAEDNTPVSKFPYSVSATTGEIRMLQPRASNSFACFLPISSESIGYTYERNPSDPRTGHSFVLETDELGNTLKSASVTYPRRSRPVAPNDIPDKVWQEQNKLHILYGEALFTNDIITDAVYRLRTGYEIKTCEVEGLVQPVDFYIKKSTLLADLAAANTILFDEEFTAGKQKRLSAHSRSYFLKDDLSGPLPLGQLSNLGIGHKSYRMAFTKNLVTKYYGGKVSNVMLSDAKYVHSEGDEHWWIQPGEVIFPAGAKDKFYTPIGTRDVFGNEHFVEFDKYTVLVKNSTDALLNKTSAVNDYRTLGPVMVTDINNNRTAVETDELGLVIKSAIMGKEGAGEGDTLADPTTRMEYEVFNWKNAGKPNYVHSFAREKHGPANTRWLEVYTYSDGGGSVIMAKKQAEPGLARKWNPLTKVVDEINADPRWVGNGRMILNNKGNPVKKFEPYFSTTHEFESEDALVETGFTSILYYDAAGRNVRTELANGTFTRSEFDPWYFRGYDVNDTVKDSTWYADRGSPDPDTDPEPLTDQEKRAAWLAAKHHNTPATVYIDSLGRNFYSVTDHGKGKTTHLFFEADALGRYAKSFDQKGRNVSEKYVNMLGVPIYGKSAEKGEKWIFIDVMGRAARIWDNALYEFRNTYDGLHRVISCYVTESGNERLFTHFYYGDGLPNAIQDNLKGKAYKIFDQAGAVTMTRVDFKGNVLSAERRLTKEYKQLIDWKPLEGLIVLNDVNNTAEPFLEKEAFLTSADLDAMNRPVTLTMADQTTIKPQYNITGFLDSLQAKIGGKGGFVTFLENQDYDAKGQRQFVKLGNGLITNYFYDPQTFRLVNLRTKTDGTPDNQRHQDLFYTFDPIGNIVYTKDDALQTHYFQNAVVKPESRFEYDAVYRLIKAGGREHAGLGGNTLRDNNDLPFIAQLPHANDVNAVRNYTEQYEYDDMGNILSLKHIATNASWTQHYHYQYEDDPGNKTNRLKSTSLPGDPDMGPYTGQYVHDARGNMTSLPHLAAPGSLTWDFRDMLSQVDLGGGGRAYYIYGMGAPRIRKVVEKQGGKRIERIYLGVVEIYREYQNNNKRFERTTVHISDNTGKIAQIDTKLLDLDSTDTANPLNTDLIRYEYGNHLGSAMMETDKDGVVISYEEYHPYGTSAYRNSKSDVDLSLKRYRFNGKEKDDETGFYYFGARYYAPWIGRWISSDPAGFISGINLFKYCSNNPVMYKDPNGLDDNNPQVTPPDIAYTGTKQQTIDFINNHELLGTYEGKTYGFRVKATEAQQTTDTEGKKFWQITKYTIIKESVRLIEPDPDAPVSDEPPPTTTGQGDGEGSGDATGAGDGAGTGGGTDAGTGTGTGTGTTGDGAGTGTGADGGTGTDAGTGTDPGTGTGTGTGDGTGSGSSDNPAAVGAPLSLSGAAGEKFIWEYPFPGSGIMGSRRGQILEWMLGTPWRSNTAAWDIETPTSVQQIKSTNDFDSIGQITRDATHDADAAIVANPTGTMGGKRPQAVIVTPSDAPASVEADVAAAIGRGRKPYTNTPLPPEHVRGLPGGWGMAARGLAGVGTALSGYSLYNDIKRGDVPMGIGDAFATAGGGLELYALSTTGATVAGVSAMSAGLVLGGVGIAITSGVSAYREFQQGDYLGGSVDVLGVLAGVAIAVGVIFAIPELLIGGAIVALGVGLFHLGRWLFS